MSDKLLLSLSSSPPFRFTRQNHIILSIRGIEGKIIKELRKAKYILGKGNRKIIFLFSIYKFRSLMFQGAYPIKGIESRFLSREDRSKRSQDFDRIWKGVKIEKEWR